jgi:glycine/D-amino acid oxidase-like deaminating enzyme
MTEVERHAYDVLVIGAGGAGLRAAIEARQQGMRVAVICKSLFGKAHTVMAEGGCAASMGNANANDNWQVHFRDTMRGGKSCTPRRRRTASGSWRPTARCSTAPRTARSASATSAATPTRAWRTSATGPGWN